MSLYFDEIDVEVNGSGIIASNASLTSSNNLEAAYVLGLTNPINQLNYGAIKTTFSFTYSPLVNQEPNFAVVNKIKQMINDSGYWGEQAELAGLSHNYCFLETYSLKVQPNNLIQAQATYSTFWPLCGQIRPKSNLINYLADGSLEHSWTTYIFGTGDYQNQPIYDLNYDFKANWTPVYVIGSPYPVQVKLLGASETINFQTDNYTNVLTTGENLYNNILVGADSNIKFNDLSLVCENNCGASGMDGMLEINIGNFKVKTVEVQGQVQQYVRVTYVGNNYY